MSEQSKVRYEIDLNGWVPLVQHDNFTIRSAEPGDLQALARLMLDAYRGTIDYDDEDLDDALSEVGSFFSDAPLLGHSLVVDIEGELVSAVLVSMSEGSAFISYVMTAPAHKSRGLAEVVTRRALQGLADDGFERVVLYITRGNAPSEALFKRLGAVTAA